MQTKSAFADYSTHHIYNHSAQSMGSQSAKADFVYIARDFNRRALFASELYA